MTDEKSSFVLYAEYLEHIKLLTMEQRGALLTAVLCYASGDELPEMDGMTNMAFSFIKSRIDRDTAAYLEKIEKRREAGKLGGRPKTKDISQKQEKAKKANGFSEKQNNPDTVPVTDTVSVFEKESKEKSLRFSPPARQDVADYCKEKGFSDFDVERFVDYYTSNGWMVGKSKMKDWKAVVRNWARAGTAPRPNNTRGNKFSNFEQRQYDYDALEAALLNSKPQGG